MKGRGGKIVAPVTITVILSAYYLTMGRLVMTWAVSTAVKIAALLIPLILSVLLITVMIQRIREIQKGEEDDLGQY